jgi:LPXTG-motif cell wall-anchored protein
MSARALRSPTARIVVGLAAMLVPLAAWSFPAAAEDAPAETVVCQDGSLARQRTEIDADIPVPGFDAALGTLLEVSVASQAVHLDTDALFENTAQTAVTFEEHMTYQVTFSSPGGLASPPPIAGTIERVPMQTLAAFDGTLDFAGASSVAQPSTARDAVAAPLSSTEPAVLAAFTGGTVAFHVATSIGETFVGGGGNVQASIHTFASASVQVCYRYAPPAPPPTTAPPTTPPPTTTPVTPPPTVQVRVAATSVRVPATPTLPATGAPDGLLAVLGTGAVVLGAVLVARTRRVRPGLDVGAIDR